MMSRNDLKLLVSGAVWNDKRNTIEGRVVQEEKACRRSNEYEAMICVVHTASCHLFAVKCPLLQTSIAIWVVLHCRLRPDFTRAACSIVFSEG